MSDLLAAAVLGLVQGLTEFLPVSSTGHLILAARLLDLDPERFGLGFAVALHMGTLLAVLIYFLPTWLGMLRDVAIWLRDTMRSEIWPRASARQAVAEGPPDPGRGRLFALIVLGTIPAAIAGGLFQDLVEELLWHPSVVAVALLAGSAVFVVAERAGRRERAMEMLGWRDAILIGAAQAIALIPGISRSGITISAGILRHVRRDEATRFAFLLATPILFAAGAKVTLDARRAEALFAQPDVLAVGFGVAFLSGLAAVAFLVRFLRTNSLMVFVAYRVVLALVLLAVLAAG